MDEDKFLSIIDATPLVSIDLVIRSERNRVLLGKRLNRPAKGFWFVPGGRIHKNELVKDALVRICKSELGVPLQPAHLIGVYDHIYHDNFHDRAGINTHYVVLGYRGSLSESVRFETDDQHSELRWWEEAELLASAEVHENTKLYLVPGAGNRDLFSEKS